GEDQLVAGARQLLDRALGVGALAHVLEIGRLDLVAERLHDPLAAELVLIGPAEVPDRAALDESALQFSWRVRLGARIENTLPGGKKERRGGHHDLSH